MFFLLVIVTAQHTPLDTDLVLPGYIMADGHLLVLPVGIFLGQTKDKIRALIERRGPRPKI